MINLFELVYNKPMYDALASGIHSFTLYFQTDSFKTVLQNTPKVSHELTAYLSVFNLFLTQWIMAILSKRWKPDNFEPHNSLKLSFTNVRGLCSNFVECKPFLESNSADILALCETNLDDSIDFGNFSVRGYLLLIRKDSITRMHSLAVYAKEGLTKTQWILTCFLLALLHSVPHFFFLYQSPSLSLWTVFDSISSNIEEVVLTNPSTNVFVLGDINIHHKDCLTYSGGNEHNFSTSNDLT